MICLIALVVFGILGIFSAKYRQISFKAFDCVFRRMTLRPCNSGLDHQLKTGVVGFLSRRSVKAARFTVKHFEIISWIFTILMIVSLFFSVKGVYYYVVYGNCNGENSNDFCVFDALNPKDQATTCTDPSIHVNSSLKIMPGVDDDPSIGPSDAKVTIIEFGCYSCPFTKKAEPVVKQVLKEYDGRVRFVYRDFHIPTHPGSEIRAEAAECADDQGKFWEFKEKLFDRQDENLTVGRLTGFASELKLDLTRFKVCLETDQYLNETNNDFEDGKLAGVYGTPTFYINNQTIVGPKPVEYFRNIIDKELRK
jgi:thiol-disulfide isomerase/thioredoxin